MKHYEHFHCVLKLYWQNNQLIIENKKWHIDWVLLWFNYMSHSHKCLYFYLSEDPGLHHASSSPGVGDLYCEKRRPLFPQTKCVWRRNTYLINTDYKVVYIVILYIYKNNSLLHSWNYRTTIQTSVFWPVTTKEITKLLRRGEHSSLACVGWLWNKWNTELCFFAPLQLGALHRFWKRLQHHICSCLLIPRHVPSIQHTWGSESKGICPFTPEVTFISS